GERQAGHMGLRARPAQRPDAQWVDQELAETRYEGDGQRFSLEDAALHRERADRRAPRRTPGVRGLILRYGLNELTPAGLQRKTRPTAVLYLHLKIRRPIENGTIAHAASVANSRRMPPSVSPSSTTPLSASTSAVSGSARMNG